MALINTTTTGVLGTTLYGDGSGNLTVQQNGVTQAIITNAPAFLASATPTVQQAITGATFTKVNFEAELFDTNNNFSSSRFTPTVAGYYQLNASLYYASSPTGQAIGFFYKNGSFWSEFGRNAAAAAGSFTGGILAYANGTTDYFEVYFYSTGANNLNDTSNTTAYVNFSGILIKAA
jgi:hypothetical protein